MVKALALALAVLALTAAAAADDSRDVTIPVMLTATLVLGGIGYGVTKQKADTAHTRLDRHEQEYRADLQRMTAELHALRVLIAERLPKPKEGTA